MSEPVLAVLFIVGILLVATFIGALPIVVPCLLVGGAIGLVQLSNERKKKR